MYNILDSLSRSSAAILAYARPSSSCNKTARQRRSSDTGRPLTLSHQQHAAESRRTHHSRRPHVMWLRGPKSIERLSNQVYRGESLPMRYIRYETAPPPRSCWTRTNCRVDNQRLRASACLLQQLRMNTDCRSVGRARAVPWVVLVESIHSAPRFQKLQCCPTIQYRHAIRL